MTIKEMEALSGMTRANIRFYESEGLFSPVRSENGYRDYSEDDLAVLKRIRLLRTLHISLEEIKAIRAGEKGLTETLERHLERLSAEQADLERSQKICREMQKDGVRFETLNAQKYLDSIEKSGLVPAPELIADKMPRVWVPWRRFFARMLDLFLYGAVWELFLTLVVHVGLLNRSPAGDLLDFVMGTALMLLVEPLLLSVFKTTFGKWIFGVCVTDIFGKKLSYRKGFFRACSVLWRGMGGRIPGYRLVRLLKCYRAYDKGEALAWEYDSELTVKDEKIWRSLACLGSYFAVAVLLLFSTLLAGMPKHRGDITVAQFCENYDRCLSYYYGSDPEYRLDPAGVWVEKKKTPGEVTVRIGGELKQPELQFVEENGIVTGIRLEQAVQDSDVWLPSYQDEMSLFILSFVLAQDSAEMINPETNDIVRWIQDHPFEDFTFTAYGIEIACDFEYSGYLNLDSGFLIAEEGARPDFSFRFTMTRIS